MYGQQKNIALSYAGSIIDGMVFGTAVRHDVCLLPPSHRHGRPLLQETQTQTIFSTVSF